MNKALTLTTLCLLPILALCQPGDTLTNTENSSQGVTYFTGTWDSLFATAKEQNKYVMVEFMTSWCGWCRKLEATTFKNKSVGEYMNEKFLSYKIDAQKGEGVAIGRKYGVREYPTVILYAPDSKLIVQTEGYMDAEVFMNFVLEYIH